MAKRDGVKQRLQHWRRQFENEIDRNNGHLDACFEAFAVRDSLKRAAKYFGLNHEDKADLNVLLHILADVVFAKPNRGRPKDGGERLFRLGVHLHLLEQQEGRLSDTDAAKKLCELPDYQSQQPDSLRKQLPAARRDLERLLQSQQWDSMPTLLPAARRELEHILPASRGHWTEMWIRLVLSDK
jgi:hypothetical protein